MDIEVIKHADPGESQWQAIQSFLNSPFTTSLIGAAMGAGVGAWMAHRIARTQKIRDQLKQDVLDSISAIEITANLVSTYINFKRQIVLDLWRTYRRQHELVHRRVAERREGVGAELGPIDVGHVDLSTITPLFEKTERLERLVLETLSISGRARPLLVTLVRSIYTLDNLIDKRNEQVTMIRSHNRQNDVNYLFGVERNGIVDVSYGQTIEGLRMYTDDCIHFGLLLCSDLDRYGKQQRDEFRRRFRADLPRLPRLNWDTPKSEGLMPPEQNYDHWRTNFVRSLPKTTGRRLARMRYAVKRRSRLIGKRLRGAIAR